MARVFIVVLALALAGCARPDRGPDLVTDPGCDPVPTAFVEVQADETVEVAKFISASEFEVLRSCVAPRFEVELARDADGRLRGEVDVQPYNEIQLRLANDVARFETRWNPRDDGRLSVSTRAGNGTVRWNDEDLPVLRYERLGNAHALDPFYGHAAERPLGNGSGDAYQFAVNSSWNRGVLVYFVILRDYEAPGAETWEDQLPGALLAVQLVAPNGTIRAEGRVDGVFGNDDLTASGLGVGDWAVHVGTRAAADSSKVANYEVSMRFFY